MTNVTNNKFLRVLAVIVLVLGLGVAGTGAKVRTRNKELVTLAVRS